MYATQMLQILAGNYWHGVGDLNSSPKAPSEVTDTNATAERILKDGEPVVNPFGKIY